MTKRQQIIQAEIIEAAALAEPYMLEENLIFTTVNLSVKPKATLAEFDDVCVEMEKRALIKRIRTADGGLKIKLTDEGRAELA